MTTRRVGARSPASWWSIHDEVEQLFVAGPHRGTGVAGLLLDEAERQVAAQGYDEAWLAVVAGNTRARRFYETSGLARRRRPALRGGRRRDDVRLALPALPQAGPLTASRGRRAQTCSRDATAACTRAIASATGTPFSWWPSR